MTLQIALLFALLAAMVYLFLTEKIPVDLTAFLGLVVLVFAGYVTPAHAFSGFSSPAVITMLSIFIVSAGLLFTGVADTVAGRLYGLVGAREIPLVITLSLLAGVLSAFMNNIAATAVLMPAVTSLAAKARLSPSRLFMPLAFGAILGGTTTLVGTPPNILAGDLLQERGLEPFGLFDYTPLGLALLGCGTLYMITVGRKLLPTREPAGDGVAPGTAAGPAELAQLYQVRDKLFALTIPQGSALAGRTLGETQLATTLGVKVLALKRGGRPKQVPRAETVLEAGDRLLLQGHMESVRELLEVRDLQASPARIADLPLPPRGIGGVRARLAEGSELAGRTLRDLGFRERHGLSVLAIRRHGRLLREELADQSLLPGDAILALGARDRLAELAASDDFEVEELGFAALQELADQVFLIRVPEASRLVGSSLAQSRVGELVGLTVAAILRAGELLPAPPPGETLRADDRLLVVAEPSRLEIMRTLGDVTMEEISAADLEGREIAMVEAAVAPRSAAVGKTLRELSFRDRYGVVVLSLWRRGQPLQGDLADVPLRLGDALLLEGRRRRIDQLVADPDFVVLTPLPQTPMRTSRAPVALGALLLMVGLVVTGYQPIHVAAFTAASLALLGGAVKMQEAYRAIEWRAIFLVAAVLPVGAAMESSGAADLISRGVVALAESTGPHVLLASLVVLASLLSQGLDGAPAVVLLTPVVLQTADSLAVSPYPLMMGVSLAASAAFMTPFSHKANLLVMGAGGYRSMDYLKVGTPLTVVILALMVYLVPVFFPF